LGVALAGWGLAKVNSTTVSAIELDRREELAAASKARLTDEAAGESGAGATLRFAEGDPEETIQEYRKLGKQVRQKGKKPSSTMRDSEPAVEEPEVPVRTLREAELVAANRLDRINLLIVRLLLLLAVGRVVVDYLARLNSTAGGYWPLPIAGGWLDSFSGKTHAVLVKTPTKDRMAPRAYAERVVKNGESFIYFGESDPWQGRDWLPRLSVWRWPVWRLPKVDYGDPAVSVNGEFALDAAWFNRASVVVRSEDGFPLFEYIVSLISQRHEAGAVARKTVHIIWDLPQAPAAETLLPLIQIAYDTNIKLAVWADASVGDEYASLFEESFAEEEFEVIVVD
jgi:hypothetical protein